jgi:hypothetical protein
MTYFPENNLDTSIWRGIVILFKILLLLNYSVKYNKNSNGYVCTNSGVGTS